jgi:hypothetical protein
MISLQGHSVPGFALGDVTSAGLDRYSRLDAVLTLMRTDAVDAKTVAEYQAVGQYGSDTLGPMIDAVGPPGVTQPMTHEAWDINAKLATSTDLVQAKTLVDLMLTDYQKAIIASRHVQERESSGWPTFWVPLGALVLIAGVWYVAR